MYVIITWLISDISIVYFSYSGQTVWNFKLLTIIQMYKYSYIIIYASNY
jgi:hypothetical protein